MLWAKGYFESLERMPVTHRREIIGEVLTDGTFDYRELEQVGPRTRRFKLL